MTEQYIGWALVWFAIGRLPRSGEEIPQAERHAEAEWISKTIVKRGGMAPADLVEEILDLHGDYLDRKIEESV